MTGDETGADRPDTESAFQEGVFQKDAFQVDSERFYGASSLTFAGIVYTALITVLGVVFATVAVRGDFWWLFGWLLGYVLLCAALFWVGVTKARGSVISWARKRLHLPPNRG